MEEFFVITVCVFILFSILISDIVDIIRDTAKYPHTKGWKWAYIQAFFWILIALVLNSASIIFGIIDHNVTAQHGLFIITIAFTIIATPAIFVVSRRSRIAFIIMTALTCIPLLWVINSIYIYLRWKEQSVILANAANSLFPDESIVEAEYEEVC